MPDIPDLDQAAGLVRPPCVRLHPDQPTGYSRSITLICFFFCAGFFSLPIGKSRPVRRSTKPTKAPSPDGRSVRVTWRITLSLFRYPLKFLLRGYLRCASPKLLADESACLPPEVSRLFSQELQICPV